jgi:hypothetical protein
VQVIGRPALKYPLWFSSGAGRLPFQIARLQIFQNDVAQQCEQIRAGSGISPKGLVAAGGDKTFTTCSVTVPAASASNGLYAF